MKIPREILRALRAGLWFVLDQVWNLIRKPKV